MARREQENPQLDMTPMIDVVFELIIFFVVTIKQEDIFSKLNANRPAPNSSAQKTEENDTQVTIDIGRDGFVFNGAGVSIARLDSNIRQISQASRKTTILVRCAMESPHKYLVDALDVCHKYGMFNLSIFSM